MIVASDPFLQFIANTFAVEGGYSDTPEDPGNWTGGATGSGILGGTMRGISSASYTHMLQRVPAALHEGMPDAVRDLSEAQCVTLYKYAYWEPACCGHLPAALAVLVADAAVNQGVSGAVHCLQEALSFAPSGSHTSDGRVCDGDIGPATLAAIQAAAQEDLAGLCIEFTYRRLIRYLSASLWTVDGHGWSRRLFRLLLVSGNYLT